MRFSILTLVTFLVTAMAAGCSGGGGDTSYLDAGNPVDQCLSSTDMEIILASRADAGPDAAVIDPLDDAYVCALQPDCYQLFLDQDYQGTDTCIHGCLDSKPSGPLSRGCRNCYVYGARLCATANCLTECLGTDHSLCEVCFADYCQADLDTCIGY